MATGARVPLHLTCAALIVGCGDDLRWRTNWGAPGPTEATEASWARAWEHRDGTRTVRFGGCAPADAGYPECSECLDVVLHGYGGEPLASLIDDAPRMTVVHGWVREPYHGPTTAPCLDTTLGVASSLDATRADAVGGRFVVEFDDTSPTRLAGRLRGDVGGLAHDGYPLPPILEGVFVVAVKSAPGGPPSEEALWSP